MHIRWRTAQSTWEIEKKTSPGILPLTLFAYEIVFIQHGNVCDAHFALYSIRCHLWSMIVFSFYRKCKCAHVCRPKRYLTAAFVILLFCFLFFFLLLLVLHNQMAEFRVCNFYVPPAAIVFQPLPLWCNRMLVSSFLENILGTPHREIFCMACYAHTNLWMMKPLRMLSDALADLLCCDFLLFNTLMIGRYFGWLEMNSWMANRWLKEDDCFVCLGVWCAGLSHPFRVFASFFRLWVAPCAVMNLFIISREINIVIFIFPRWLYTIYIYNRYRVTHHSRKRWTISIHSGWATFFTCFTRLSNARSR